MPKTGTSPDERRAPDPPRPDQRRRVARAVGQEHPVGLRGEDLVGARSPAGTTVDLAARAHEVAQDGALDAEVEATTVNGAPSSPTA